MLSITDYDNGGVKFYDIDADGKGTGVAYPSAFTFVENPPEGYEKTMRISENPAGITKALRREPFAVSAYILRELYNLSPAYTTYDSRSVKNYYRTPDYLTNNMFPRALKVRDNNYAFFKLPTTPSFSNVYKIEDSVATKFSGTSPYSSDVPDKFSEKQLHSPSGASATQGFQQAVKDLCAGFYGSAEYKYGDYAYVSCIYSSIITTSGDTSKSGGDTSAVGEWHKYAITNIDFSGSAPWSCSVTNYESQSVINDVKLIWGDFGDVCTGYTVIANASVTYWDGMNSSQSKGTTKTLNWTIGDFEGKAFSFTAGDLGLAGAEGVANLMDKAGFKFSTFNPSSDMFTTSGMAKQGGFSVTSLVVQIYPKWDIAI